MGESSRSVFWGNNQGRSTDIYSSDESGTKRIKLSPTNPQDVHSDNSIQPRRLGLKLTKSKSLQDLAHERLCKGKQAKFGDDKPKLNVDDFRSRDKVKAINFPAVLLRIGSWQRVRKNGGDLVGKLYYAKHKMVWEILNGSLKSKIEIQWSDITAIRAIFNHNQQEILEIELKQPPLFYGETDPQPRKHTLWKQSSDFTEGQASIYRRHYVACPPGSLAHHFEKLLQCDLRLFALSQKQFPSQECPFFDSVINRNLQIPSNFNGYQINHSTIGWGTQFETTPNSSLPVMNWPIGNERGRDFQLVTHNENVSIQRPFHITSSTQGNEVFSSQNYQSSGIGNVSSIQRPIQRSLHIASSSTQGNDIFSSQGYQSPEIGNFSNQRPIQRSLHIASSSTQGNDIFSSQGYQSPEIGNFSIQRPIQRSMHIASSSTQGNDIFSSQGYQSPEIGNFSIQRPIQRSLHIASSSTQGNEIFSSQGYQSSEIGNFSNQRPIQRSLHIASSSTQGNDIFSSQGYQSPEIGNFSIQRPIQRSMYIASSSTQGNDIFSSQGYQSPEIGNFSIQRPIQRSLHIASSSTQGNEIFSSQGYQSLGIGNFSIQRPLHITSSTQGNKVSSSQDYQSNGIVSNNIDSHLLRYPQVAGSNGITLARVQPMMHLNLDPIVYQQLQ